MLKNIIKYLKPSSTLKINEISRELEIKGEKIFKFGFGQSPFQVPLDIVNELKNNAHQNKYLPMQGLKELRETVAKYVSTKKDYNYNSKNVIIGPKSYVVKSIKANSYFSGNPARNHKDHIRQDILIAKLPKIYKKIFK